MLNRPNSFWAPCASTSFNNWAGRLNLNGTDLGRVSRRSRRRLCLRLGTRPASSWHGRRRPRAKGHRPKNVKMRRRACELEQIRIDASSANENKPPAFTRSSPARFSYVRKVRSQLSNNYENRKAKFIVSFSRKVNDCVRFFFFLAALNNSHHQGGINFCPSGKPFCWLWKGAKLRIAVNYSFHGY